MSVEVEARIPHTLRPHPEHPYLNGPFTPVWEELTASELPVIGRIPTDIDGIYFRNTQNQVHEPLGKFHLFDGDGMIHAMSFHEGRATYRNRFVRTKGFRAEQEAGRSLWAGIMEHPSKSTRPGWGAHEALKDASSTDVVLHAGLVLSTYYQCGDGYRLDPETLETLGTEGWVPVDGISAHPKVDERTGELLFFNYSKHPPYMHYGVADASNRLVHYVPIPLDGPRLPHDMAFTERYAILNDLPLFWDPELLKQGHHVVRFHPRLPSRFAIIPRRGKPEEIRWFEAAPTYVLHWVNAWEDGDEVVLDGYFEEEPMPKSHPNAPEGLGRMMSYLDQYMLRPKLHRWRFDLRTGRTREERLDDRILEFGMINQRFGGRRNRYAYSAVQAPGLFLFAGLVKHDHETGRSWQIPFGEGRFGSESPFAPRIGARDEDDGYLVSFITDEKAGTSECILVDCKDFEAGPVCRIQLPHKIASGTHSTWADRAQLRRPSLAR